jgi:septal ring factor EnvC (AmiA/AmiB activator)
MDWISLLQVVGGLISGIGLASFTKAGRVKAKSDAYAAMSKAYDDRIAALHVVIDNYNKTEIEHSKRISDLNHKLNQKEERNRELSDRLYEAQQEINRVNDRLTEEQEAHRKTAEDRDEERRKKDYFKRWRCEKSTCNDPDGRIPPNSKLSSEKFKSPE